MRQHHTFTLSMIRLFSSIAFATLYSTLEIFLTAKAKFSLSTATDMVGTFLALNYVFSIIGGYMGGKLVSYRGLLFVSIILQTAGCAFFITQSQTSIDWLIATFLTGCLGTSVSINMLITKLYKPEDIGRETAFFWNYMAMNAGYFIGYSLSGYFANIHHYNYIFFATLIAGLTSILFMTGLINYKHDPQTKSGKKIIISAAIIILTLICSHQLIILSSITNTAIIALWVIIIALLFYKTTRISNTATRRNMMIFTFILLCATFFWSIYFIAPMGLIMFIKSNVSLNIYGITVAPQWIQDINTIIVVAGSVFMAIVSKHLFKNKKPNLPMHFFLGIALLGLGFLILCGGIMDANKFGSVALFWVATSYALQSCGELFVGPIGLAAVGRLVPEKDQGILTGVWIMLLGVAGAIASKLSNIISATPDSLPISSDPSYLHLFGTLGIASIIVGLTIWGISKYMLRA